MKNKIFIISGPSGAGEDSIIRKLAKLLPIKKIVTTTTRKKRESELDGSPCSYHFISKEEFKKEILENRFFEYAEQCDELYGVTKEEIKRVVDSDKIGIWKIEYKGVIAAKKLMPEVVAILIVPSSLEILKQRLLKRGESKEFIQQRMNYAEEWLKHKDIYDYEVVNYEGKLDETVEEVKEIILKECNK